MVHTTAGAAGVAGAAGAWFIQTEKRVRLDVAKFSFSNRVVNEWNILDEEIISGCSLAGFKRKLDRHLRDKRGYISYSFLPRYRHLDDLDPLTHQVQVQVQVTVVDQGSA